MHFRQICTWLLASAITVVVAVILLTVIVPTRAQAGSSWQCFNAYVDEGGYCHYDPFPRSCSEVRANCRTLGYTGFKKHGFGDWQLMCGEPLGPGCPPDIGF